MVTLPDALIRSSRLPAKAKILWCFLRLMEALFPVLSFIEVRKATGLAQNTLLKYLDLLVATGWLRYGRQGNHFTYKAIWKRGRPAFRLPLDLICDRAVPAEAKLVYGTISKLKKSFDYEELRRHTGYSQGTLFRYLSILLRLGWLRGSESRAGRKKRYHVTVHNPHQENIKRDVELFQRAKSLAQKRNGYSVGQLLFGYMVSLLVDKSLLIENGHLWGLVNYKTGGRLLYDLLLPEERVAMEFQGPQHYAPTRLYPNESEFRAQQARDALKRTLSERLGIRLIEVKAEDLSFPRLAELLRSAGVALKANPRAAAPHLYDLLEQEAALYRATAA